MAARVVFGAGAPVTLVPLDATNDLQSSRLFWEVLDRAAQTAAAETVRNAWEANGEWIDNSHGFFYFWDELAAAVVVDESLVEFEERTLVVDVTDRDRKGWTREDAGGATVRVAISADRLAFEQLFLDTIVGAPVALAYVEASEKEILYLEALSGVETRAAEEFDALFESAAATLPVGPDDEEGFFTVLTIALPRIFAGPWMDRIESLDALDVPDEFVGAHNAYTSALWRAVNEQGALLDVLSSGDLDGLPALLRPVAESCRALQAEADIRLVDVRLGCLQD